MKQLKYGLLTLLCLLLMGGTLAYALDPYDNRIVDGVQVGGLELGGMTLEQAHRALDQASKTHLEGSDMIARLPEETLVLSPTDTDVKLRRWSAVAAAWRVGRLPDAPPEIGLLPHLKLNQQSIQSLLDDYARQYDTNCTPSRYELVGSMPDLEIDSNEKPTQTLNLTLGLPTARLDREDAFQKILAAYDRAFANDGPLTDFRVDVLEEPEPPDLQAIYEDVYLAPVDDALDMETFQIIPGAWGYCFDQAQAEKLVAAGAWGKTLSIPMLFQEPEIFGDEVYFRDVLGYCETKHTTDENRNNNLRRACESMNGLILQPGEVFSYNDTLGPRTKENGYLRAGSYSGWELVLSYGGGICQGSTTIYGAALDADLEIVQRKNHGYLVSYVEPGLDATVNWGGPDFQFRNSTHFPIKIAAEVSDGFVRVSILGTEERDYDIEMESDVQWGKHAIYAKSYRCKYDRETGRLLSRELEARSNYMR